MTWMCRSWFPSSKTRKHTKSVDCGSASHCLQGLECCSINSPNPPTMHCYSSGDRLATSNAAQSPDAVQFLALRPIETYERPHCPYFPCLVIAAQMTARVYFWWKVVRTHAEMRSGAANEQLKLAAMCATAFKELTIRGLMWPMGGHDRPEHTTAVERCEQIHILRECGCWS